MPYLVDINFKQLFFSTYFGHFAIFNSLTLIMTKRPQPSTQVTGEQNTFTQHTTHQSITPERQQEQTMMVHINIYLFTHKN